MLILLKSGSLNLLEPSEPVQACNGIAFYVYTKFRSNFSLSFLTINMCFLKIYS